MISTKAFCLSLIRNPLGFFNALKKEILDEETSVKNLSPHAKLKFLIGFVLDTYVTPSIIYGKRVRFYKTLSLLFVLRKLNIISSLIAELLKIGRNFHLNVFHVATVMDQLRQGISQFNPDYAQEIQSR